jgi:hypothetical protein
MLALALMLFAVAVPASKATQTGAATAGGPRVEVAFVLDTTGSMGGLIDGAKRRIWSIARRIGEGRPRPDLKVALVAYRDRGDQYVTRVFDLTGDVDEVYRNLMSFEANGGGDTPEHVSAALHDAVHKVSWSQERTLKMIFLVGDAPPHMDYQDGFDYRRHVREAAARGIAVEAIECGADAATADVWREIARLGGGHYAQIDADGGMPVRVTPADAELAKLNGELLGTVVAGGSARERALTAARLGARAAMPAPMAAEAASYYASSGRLAEKDLVDLPAAEQQKELQAARAAGAPPATLVGKSDAEALAFLGEQKARRAKLQTRIIALQKQRDEYLATSGGAKDAFDEAVVSSLREKAKDFGIAY